MWESNQKTLNSSIEFTGVGLHTGEGVHMVIEPAEINHGVKFQRIDLENQPVLPADINLVTDTQRSTTLEKDNVKIVTVEHLMSALYALGVNNVLIKMVFFLFRIFSVSFSSISLKNSSPLILKISAISLVLLGEP